MSTFSRELGIVQQIILLHRYLEAQKGFMTQTQQTTVKPNEQNSHANTEKLSARLALQSGGRGRDGNKNQNPQLNSAYQNDYIKQEARRGLTKRVWHF